MNEFLHLLRFDAARENAEKHGGKRIIAFLVFITLKRDDGRERGFARVVQE
ncbi:hypothetical protein BH11PLA2_BH11PLA2_21120 [soil metagenome]